MSACLPGVKIHLSASVGLLVVPRTMSATSVGHRHGGQSPASAGEAQPHTSIGPWDVGVRSGRLQPRLCHPRVASCQGLSTATQWPVTSDSYRARTSLGPGPRAQVTPGWSQAPPSVGLKTLPAPETAQASPSNIEQWSFPGQQPQALGAGTLVPHIHVGPGGVAGMGPLRSGLSSPGPHIWGGKGVTMAGTPQLARAGWARGWTEHRPSGMLRPQVLRVRVPLPAPVQN